MRNTELAAKESKILAFTKLIRVKQYFKNGFIFAALLFTKNYSHPFAIRQAFLAFVAMCLLSSSTYIANDLVDLERDRAHPKKKNRPLASGTISPTFGIFVTIVFLVGGLALAGFVRNRVFECGVFYILLQVIYNLKLKRIPIADVFVIATGFVIRVVIGAVAIQAALSGWILLCTASLALLLGFGKRRHEFQSQGEDRHKSRESLGEYTLDGLNALVMLSAGFAAMAYGVYSIDSASARQFPALILTTPFVVYGICRYIVLIFGQGQTDEPESIVMRDPQMVITLILFAATAVYALSGPRIAFLTF